MLIRVANREYTDQTDSEAVCAGSALFVYFFAGI